jgi:PucR-like helix-turn-helix protein
VPDRAVKTPMPGRVGETPVVRLSQLAALMRPELPGLAREIIAEIRDRIPEYARPMEGPFGHALRLGVQQVLTSFFDSLADPSSPGHRHDHMCRRLGQMEATEGRSLDSLQAAYRVGIQVGWHRAMEVGLACGAPSTVMSQLADAVLAYMDELATLSRQGYLEAKARSGQSHEEWRRRLLHLILERPPAPRRALAELAELIGWDVPGEVTLIATEPGPACPAALATAGALADFTGPRPHLLLPGAVGAAHRELLEQALPGRGCAVGLPVPLEDAAHSLRWARRALALRRCGVIGGGTVTFCEDHLVELWLLCDEALADQVARRQLSAFAELTPLQRQRLTDTFGTWLETRGTAAEMAGRLNVHPQTVRYRMRKLERTLGGQLDDPDARFALELSLRATRLRDRAARPEASGPPAETPAPPAAASP